MAKYNVIVEQEYTIQYELSFNIESDLDEDKLRDEIESRVCDWRIARAYEDEVAKEFKDLGKVIDVDVSQVGDETESGDAIIQDIEKED